MHKLIIKMQSFAQVGLELKFAVSFSFNMVISFNQIVIQIILSALPRFSKFVSNAP